MDAGLSERYALFVRNRDAVRGVFRFQSTYMYPLCAALYAGRDRAVDAPALRAAMDLLKANVGLFSNFRNLARCPIAAQLAMDPDPQSRMDNSLVVYDLLKEEFSASAYLPIAAVTLAGEADPAAYGGIAARTRTLYLGMRKAHPLLTSSEDAIYAALLALSPRQDEDLIDAMEQCYHALKPRFLSGNAVQALAAVLALGDLSPDDACARTLALYDALLSCGLRYGRGYELPTLGALALTNADVQQLAVDLCEGDAFLSHQRGFGAMGIGRRQRLMYAALLLLPEAEQSANAAAVTGTIAMIVAQQAAIAAAVAASAAASSASS